jgi:HNH endonuclease
MRVACTVAPRFRRIFRGLPRSACVACGDSERAHLEHHHVTPRSHGGSDDETNIITLCWVCHGKAHGTGRNIAAVDIRRLQNEGRARARAAGVHIGRPRKLTPHQRAEAIKPRRG